MSASDVKTISDLIVGPAGALVLAVAVILAFARAGWWLLTQVLQAKDAAIAYRDGQITYRDGLIATLQGQVVAFQGQVTRQQDLFDGAMDLLQAEAPRRRPRGGS